jgi:hypothetical protein
LATHYSETEGIRHTLGLDETTKILANQRSAGRRRVVLTIMLVATLWRRRLDLDVPEDMLGRHLKAYIERDGGKRYNQSTNERIVLL